MIHNQFIFVSVLLLLMINALEFKKISAPLHTVLKFVHPMMRENLYSANCNILKVPKFDVKLEKLGKMKTDKCAGYFVE